MSLPTAQGIVMGTNTYIVPLALGGSFATPTNTILQIDTSGPTPFAVGKADATLVDASSLEVTTSSRPTGLAENLAVAAAAISTTVGAAAGQTSVAGRVKQAEGGGEKGGMSGVGVAGVAIGCFLLGTLICGFVTFLFLRRLRRKHQSERGDGESDEVALEEKHDDEFPIRPRQQRGIIKYLAQKSSIERYLRPRPSTSSKSSVEKSLRPIPGRSAAPPSAALTHVSVDSTYVSRHKPRPKMPPSRLSSGLARDSMASSAGRKSLPPLPFSESPKRFVDVAVDEEDQNEDFGRSWGGRASTGTQMAQTVATQRSAGLDSRSNSIIGTTDFMDLESEAEDEEETKVASSSAERKSVADGERLHTGLTDQDESKRNTVIFDGLKEELRRIGREEKEGNPFEDAKYRTDDGA